MMKSNQVGTSANVVVTKLGAGGAFDGAQLLISGQELFYCKLKQSFESMVRTKQREQLHSIHELLCSCDMILKPELETTKSQVASRMEPFRRQATTLG